jgi:chemotaxis protein CheD
MSGREIICQIGEAKLGREGDTLRATLGSCIGICLIWRQHARCALAHCLLPDAPTKSFEINAKYISQAVPSLLTLLKIRKEAYGELEAVVVGGAHMIGTHSLDGTKSIGQSNSETAMKCLKGLGIKIIHLDIGGEFGRQISINCNTYEYLVRKIEKP